MTSRTMTTQEHFEEHGWVIVKGAVPRGLATQWAQKAILDSHRGYRIDREDETGEDGREMRHHFVIDGYQVQKSLPDLWNFYQRKLLRIARETVGREFVLSPYEKSAVNVKVYAPGDDHGWHFDTNAFTALLYLTKTDEATGTLVRQRNGEEAPLIASPGDLLLMEGRELEHKVRAVPEHYPTRVTVPLNLYTEDDVERPEGTDDLVYGSA